jgi:hypothetical protein
VGDVAAVQTTFAELGVSRVIHLAGSRGVDDLIGGGLSP